ncbi:type II toxin-antitoxin system Phd/YefM family antitoxin [Nonomuraea sp. NPDC050404]|uniref:type II toxin-antitoxin system Phd/YefM family antitoxin n=1 Tax=Nonomuraea sp. NPDC050404 TaxID=3155783 RepID=UPI00340A7950
MTAGQIESTTWQVQEAKQRFSEVLRRAHDEGPQIVTRHGQDVAVILDMEEYRQLTGKQSDFKEFLLSAPDLSLLDLSRDTSTETREVGIEGGE